MDPLPASPFGLHIPITNAFHSPLNADALHFPCETFPSHSRNIHDKEALNDLFYYNIKAARSSTVNY